MGWELKTIVGGTLVSGASLVGSRYFSETTAYYEKGWRDKFQALNNQYPYSEDVRNNIETDMGNEQLYATISHGAEGASDVICALSSIAVVIALISLIRRARQ